MYQQMQDIQERIRQQIETLESTLHYIQEQQISQQANETYYYDEYTQEVIAELLGA